MQAQQALSAQQAIDRANAALAARGDERRVYVVPYMDHMCALGYYDPHPTIGYVNVRYCMGYGRDWQQALDSLMENLCAS